MKKLLATLSVFALLLLLCAGCQSALAAADHTVTPENALDIALEDANLTKEEVRDVEIDWEKGHIEVEFEKDGKDYDYDIHVETGEILNKEVPVSTEPVTPPATEPVTPAPAEPKRLTRDEAVAIALAHAGLTKQQIRDLDAELDKERGVLHYEVDFESGGFEYEYEIHAETGVILKAEKERD